jgi:hypothetical protein
MEILKTMMSEEVEERGGLVRAGLSAYCGSERTTPTLVIRLEQSCLIRPMEFNHDQSYILYKRTPFGDDVAEGKAIDMPHDLLIGIAMAGFAWEKVATDPASG